MDEEQTVETIEETPPEKTSKALTKTPVSKGVSWAWDQRKRKAVKLVVQGRSVRQIAREVEAHYTTIQRWKGNPEFQAAVFQAAKEYVNKKRFRRVHETGVIADQLATQVAMGLKKATEQAVEYGAVDQKSINSLQLFLREYREFREQERSDFGDDIKRVEGNFIVSMPGTEGKAAGAAGAQSFKAFVEKNEEKISRKVLETTDTPQEALVEATRELAVKTTILDDIFEEELAAEERERK